MKTYKLIFSTRFKNRLEAIADYIFASSKSAEVTVRHIGGIKTSLQILKTFPLLGREAKEFGDGIKKIVILDYTVLYFTDEKQKQVEILNIFRENLP